MFITFTSFEIVPPSTFPRDHDDAHVTSFDDISGDAANKVNIVTSQLCCLDIGVTSEFL